MPNSNQYSIDDAATTPFPLSVVTVDPGKGYATKALIPDPQGRPSRDPARGLWIAGGTLEQVEVEGLTGLRTLLAGLTTRQALVHGIPRDPAGGPRWTLVTDERYSAAPGTIARTKACLDWPPGPHLLLLDYDPDPAAPGLVESADALLARLGAVWPAFLDAGYLITTSTSSGIQDKATGAWLVPPRGLHLYPLVTGDVDRFKQAFTARLWLAGEGFMKLASPNAHTGVAAMLERALIDLTVFSPERLDYVAGAEIAPEAPFVQVRATPVLRPGRILALDTFPALTPAERTAAAALVAEAKARLVPTQHALIRARLTAEQPALAAEAVQQQVVFRLTHAARGTLGPDHPLYFPHAAVTAGTLGEAEDGKRLADPQEPTYGPSDAVFHWRQGNWRIVSWAHGVKRIYRLDPTAARPAAPAPVVGRAGMPWSALETPGAPHPSPGPAAGSSPLPYSDTFNAQALVARYGHNMLYVDEWERWYVWHPRGYWSPDQTQQMMKWSKQTLYALLAQADQCSDSRQRQALQRHVTASLSTGRLEAMGRNARSEGDLAIDYQTLDCHPYLLACQNGTLDLRTGLLGPHDRAHRLTWTLDTPYDPEAPCPLWHALLWRILGGTGAWSPPAMGAAERHKADTEAQALYDFLQRYFGSCLTGDIRDQALVILHGEGGNGKSTVIITLLRLLGQYAKKGSTELLLVTYTDKHPTERTDFFRKRLVAAVETQEGRRLDENLVKELTGSEPITARRMREDMWTFEPTHKLLLATNHKPEIRGMEYATWRRIHLVPFTVIIPEPDRDPELLDKLKAEYPGILAWLVRGCRAWMATGLQPPESVQTATQAYRQEQDVLGAFLADCCQQGKDHTVKASALYDAYKTWSANATEPTMSQRKFGQRMGLVKGIDRYLNNGVWYLGVTLLPAATPDPGPH